MLDRVNHLAGTFEDEGSDVAARPDGGFLFGGEFGGSFTLQLPGGPTVIRSGPYMDGFAVSYDPEGAAEWVSTVYSRGYAGVESVAAGPTGLAAIAGTHAEEAWVAHDRPDEIYLPDRNGPFSTHDMFVVVFDSAGSALWATTIGGRGDLQDAHVAFGDDGALYASGRYVGEVEIGPAGAGVVLPDGDGDNVFLARFDASTGVVDWVRLIAGPGGQVVHGLARASSDVMVAGGVFTGQLTFSYGRPEAVTVESGDPYGRRKVFLAGYDTEGSLRWHDTPGTVRGNDDVARVVSNETGFQLVGLSGNQGVFGSDQPNEYRFGEDFTSYVALYLADGAFHSMFPVPQNNVHGLALLRGSGFDGQTLAAGGVATSVHIFGEGDSATTYETDGSYDPFVALYHADGRFRCLVTHRASSSLHGNSIHATWFDLEGRLWVMGNFLGRLTVAEGTRQEQTLYSDDWDTFLIRYRLVDAPAP